MNYSQSTRITNLNKNFKGNKLEAFNHHTNTPSKAYDINRDYTLNQPSNIVYTQIVIKPLSTDPIQN